MDENFVSTHRSDYPTRVFARPIDYFQGDAIGTKSPLGYLVMTASSVAIALTSTLGYNRLTHRPYLSGIQRHVVGLAIALIGSHYLYQYRLNNLAERDAAIRHYMELHPEDFPPIERKLYRDVLHTWYPRR